MNAPASILAGMTAGVARTGIRMVIAAQEKMGKTTLCAQAPDTLLVPLEVGFAGVSVKKTPMLNTFAEVQQLVQEIKYYAKQGQAPCRTLAFDSTTALERLIHEHVLSMETKSKTATMASAHGGYGKAYDIARIVTEAFLRELDELAVVHGINILMTCHVFSAKVVDPTVGEYDSWDLLLHSPKNSKTYGMREFITQWADVIAFVYEPVFLLTADKSTVTRGVSANKGRVMGVSRTPGYTAGNRFGMVAELQIPGPPANGWNTFADALFKASGIDLYNRAP